MGKDNSAISKLIIKYIIDNKTKTKLSSSQIKNLAKGIPKEIMNVGVGNLFHNSLITGTNKKIYKVNYNHKSNWFSPLNWQKQPKYIFEFLNIKYNENKSSKENFYNLLNKIGIKSYVDFLFKQITLVDDIVIINKKINKIETYKTSLFDFEFSEIETDILESFWNKNTWFIDVDGYRLLQIQIPASKNRPNSLIARIDTRKLEKFSKSVVRNNETWGISVEAAICKKFNIHIPKEYEGRYDLDLVEQAMEELNKFDNTPNYLKYEKCLATKTTGRKKSSTDFLADNKTVSVKSNFNSNTKVCPPDIGQPGIKNGLKYYNKIFKTNIKEEELQKNGMKKFKKEFIKNISQITQDQVKHLFSEDYILYMKKGTKDIKTILIDTSNKEYTFNKNKFNFTQNEKGWKESTSISYDGISLAEMQLHHNRSPFKFRFNLLNLLLIIKRMNSTH